MISLGATSIAELTLRIVNLPDRSRWCALVVEHGVQRDIVSQLELELRTSLNAEISRVNWFRNADEFIRAFLSDKSKPTIVSGLEAFSDNDWRKIDYDRSRLQRQFPVVFILTHKELSALLTYAPNLASLFGPNLWRRGVEPSVLSQNEVETRLKAFRVHFKMSDDELIRRAEGGHLTASPDFEEWLLLLGRSELIETYSNHCVDIQNEQDSE